MGGFSSGSCQPEELRLFGHGHQVFSKPLQRSTHSFLSRQLWFISPFALFANIKALRMEGRARPEKNTNIEARRIPDPHPRSSIAVASADLNNTHRASGGRLA